jgi:hypothetical protein
MSEKVSKKATLNTAALKAAVKDINRHKETASEAAGRAGNATKNACETYNFNKKALTLVAGLAKKEPAQQLEVLGAVVSYAAGMGMFDGSDMFNDHIKAMQDVIDAATKGKPAGSAGASMVADLAAATSTH